MNSNVWSKKSWLFDSVIAKKNANVITISVNKVNPKVFSKSFTQLSSDSIVPKLAVFLVS